MALGLYLSDPGSREEDEQTMADEELIREARQSLLEHDKERATDVAKRGLAAGISPERLMNEGFIAGIRELGERFDEGEVFLPELMLAAEAMEAAMAVCNAALPEGQSESRGTVVIGTVKGDVHDIGKAIVVSYLRASGYAVFDLGRDVEAETFVEQAIARKADIVGSSALLTATLRQQRDIEEALREAGVRDKVRTVVGGAVCTQGWASEIGADAYARDALDGVNKIEALIGARV
jgi:trimethylamine corrinoid protein